MKRIVSITNLNYLGKEVSKTLKDIGICLMMRKNRIKSLLLFL